MDIKVVKHFAQSWSLLQSMIFLLDPPPAGVIPFETTFLIIWDFFKNI